MMNFRAFTLVSLVCEKEMFIGQVIMVTVMCHWSGDDVKLERLYTEIYFSS